MFQKIPVLFFCKPVELFSQRLQCRKKWIIVFISKQPLYFLVHLCCLPFKRKGNVTCFSNRTTFIKSFLVHLLQMFYNDWINPCQRSKQHIGITPVIKECRQKIFFRQDI